MASRWRHHVQFDRSEIWSLDLLFQKQPRYSANGPIWTISKIVYKTHSHATWLNAFNTKAIRSKIIIIITSWIRCCFLDEVGRISYNHCLYHASPFLLIPCILFHQSIFLRFILCFFILCSTCPSTSRCFFELIAPIIYQFVQKYFKKFETKQSQTLEPFIHLRVWAKDFPSAHQLRPAVFGSACEFLSGWSTTNSGGLLSFNGKYALSFPGTQWQLPIRESNQIQQLFDY